MFVSFICVLFALWYVSFVRVGMFHHIRSEQFVCGSSIQDPGSWIQDPGFIILDPGYCIMDAPYLDAGSRIHDVNRHGAMLMDQRL